MGKTNNVSDKVEMAADLEDDLCTVVEWGEKWLVSFNASKTTILSINRFRIPFLLFELMNDSELTESMKIRFLGLAFTNDFSWNPYIESIAKSIAMKVGSLFRVLFFLPPKSI